MNTLTRTAKCCTRKLYEGAIVGGGTCVAFAKSAYTSGYRSSYAGKDSASRRRKRFVSRRARQISRAPWSECEATSRGAGKFLAKDNLLRNSSGTRFVREAASSTIRHPIDHGRAIYACELTVTPLYATLVCVCVRERVRVSGRGLWVLRIECVHALQQANVTPFSLIFKCSVYHIRRAPTKLSYHTKLCYARRTFR